jgi:hypothetical protein
MMTPTQLLEELDNRFELLLEHHAQTITELNDKSSINLQTININRLDYKEKIYTRRTYNYSIVKN